MAEDIYYNRYRTAVFFILAAILASAASSIFFVQTAYAANTLTINGYALDGRSLGMWIVISQSGTTVKTGFTPLTFAGTTGAVYSVQAHDYSGGNIVFDHWQDGSTVRTRTVTLSSDTSIAAFYKTPNSPPVAANDSATVNQDNSVTINVLSNDSDPDGDSLAILSTTTPLHGSVAVNSNGTVTYTPVARFSGQDSFAYTISDGKGATASATVNIQVNFVNYPPIATNQNISTNEDTPLPIALRATDANGDPLTFSIVSQPSHGSLSPASSGSGNFTYTPYLNYRGQDGFSFKANDGRADSNVAAVSITVIPVNHAPTAISQTTRGNQDTAIPITLAATDVDGDSLNFFVVGSPSHGMLTGTAPNLTYTPNPNYSGQDSFTFKANDGSLDSNIATVSITVLHVNHNPVAHNDAATTNQDTSVTINALANDTDVDGDVLKIVSTTTPAHGSASVATDGSNIITYKPAAGFYGADLFNYTITDGNGGTSTAVVSITVKFVPSTYTLAVNSVDMYGNAASGLYTVISKAGTTANTGFTPLSYTGAAGATYSVTVSDYASMLFDHWDNGSTARARTVTLSSDTAITAVFRVPTIKITPASGPNGTLISVSGTYFTPSSTVTVAYDSGNVATASTNTAGAFTASFKAPSLGAGLHTVQATDGMGWKASSKFQDTTPPPPHPLRYLIPKNGIYVALYMYPDSSTGAVEWQKVYDQKVAHPSVPIVAAFNPNSGPGSLKDSTIATWVAKLKSAGMIMIGYTYDSYGARSLTDLKADADKYKSWYNADGLFIDEFTNQVGYEQHYKDVTAYVKSTGMKMTLGNPGTDVPKSYVGAVDVLNITEGAGYMPISWLQYCVQCSADQAWHNQYDSLYFSYTRYDITSLDTAFESESSKYVGLLYITNGNDSNGRWFHLPPYFSTEVATLDR